MRGGRKASAKQSKWARRQRTSLRPLFSFENSTFCICPINRKLSLSFYKKKDGRKWDTRKVTSAVPPECMYKSFRKTSGGSPHQREAKTGMDRFNATQRVGRAVRTNRQVTGFSAQNIKYFSKGMPDISQEPKTMRRMLFNRSPRT